MPSSAKSELTAPPPGSASAARPAPHAHGAGPNGSRRVSADSFRQLTARLKRSAGDAVAAVAAEGAEPPLAAQAAPLPAVAHQLAAVAEAFAAEPPPAPPAPEEPAAAELPAFEPAAGMGAAPELPAFAPLQAFVPLEPPADQGAEDVLFVTPDPFGGIAAAAGVEPAPAELPTFELQPVDLPPQPEAEPYAVAPVVDESEPAPAIEEYTAEDWPDASAGEPVAEAVAEELAAPEPAEWGGFDQPDDVAEAAGAYVEGVEEPSALEAVAEPVDAVQAETAASAGQDTAPAELPEAVPAPIVIRPSEAAPSTLQPEPRTPTSEMAGRVVDAMLKTISTAIYAKPSAAERAAFLREMASLMEDAANSDVPLAPEFAAPIAAAPVIAPPPPMPTPVTVVAATPAPAAAAADAGLGEVLADRIGPSAAAVLKPRGGEEEPDPFAEPAPRSRLAEPAPEETPEADEESGELALTLLDMMSGGTGSLPHERTLAADTLLRILPRIPVKPLIAVVERVSIMEAPPALLVAKLIRDSRADVVGPLLERCSHISDQDLMNAAPDHDAPKLRMIARRRTLSTVLSDYLISTGDPGVLLTLIRNPGAALSYDAFFRLSEFASSHHALLAPLTTRADLPPPVAFELFWHVPQELRRFIFSRFLTDSENLNRILRITLATHTGENGEMLGDGKFAPREAVDAALDSAASFRLDEAAAKFGEMAGIARDTALRVLSDREGEPVTVLLKALGSTRARFEDALAKLRGGETALLNPQRKAEELQAIFDGLSFNKARILLTYWDWFVRKAGPYAPHH